MDALGIIALILAVAGILGGFLPVIPGPPLSGAAILCVYFSNAAADKIPTASLIFWISLSIILVIADYIIPGMLTKLTGGHKAAEKGATIGLLAGIFLTPVGMIAGSFIGAFIGEFLAEKQGVSASLKAAAGAFLGFLVSTGIKVIFSVLALWQVLIHLF